MVLCESRAADSEIGTARNGGTARGKARKRKGQLTTQMPSTIQIHTKLYLKITIKTKLIQNI
jgi:hypothetical protein